MINFEKQKYFLQQYFQLEEMLINSSRYVAYDIKNKDTFSVEYMTIIFQSCSAIESLVKEIFDIKKGQENTIDDYRKLIEGNDKYKEMLKEYVSFNSFMFYPFKNFYNPVGKDKKIYSPSWWRDYQKIKHDQYKNFSLANMKNAISCLGAFYLLLLKEDMVEMKSKILNIRTAFAAMGSCVENQKYSWSC